MRRIIICLCVTVLLPGCGRRVPPAPPQSGTDDRYPATWLLAHQLLRRQELRPRQLVSRRIPLPAPSVYVSADTPLDLRWTPSGRLVVARYNTGDNPEDSDTYFTVIEPDGTLVELPPLRRWFGCRQVREDGSRIYAFTELDWESKQGWRGRVAELDLAKKATRAISMRTDLARTLLWLMPRQPFRTYYDSVGYPYKGALTVIDGSGKVLASATQPKGQAVADFEAAAVWRTGDAFTAAVPTLPATTDHWFVDWMPSVISVVRFPQQQGQPCVFARQFTPLFGRAVPLENTEPGIAGPEVSLTMPSVDQSGGILAFRERASIDCGGVNVFLLWVWRRGEQEPFIAATVVRWGGNGPFRDFTLGWDGSAKVSEPEWQGAYSFCGLRPALSPDGRRLAYIVDRGVVVVDLP